MKEQSRNSGRRLSRLKGSLHCSWIVEVDPGTHTATRSLPLGKHKGCRRLCFRMRQTQDLINEDGEAQGMWKCQKGVKNYWAIRSNIILIRRCWRCGSR